MAVREILQERYRLHPYLYTLTYQAHTAGSTVVRPLFYEYPTDHVTFDIDEQFLWGSNLLISPALTASNDISFYLPTGSLWFDYFTGEKVPSGWQSKHLELDEIALHVRSGSIIPIQDPAATTAESRCNTYGLIYSMDTQSTGKGELFIDDGESINIDNYIVINFSGSSTKLTSTPTIHGTMSTVQSALGCSESSFLVLNNLTIYGVEDEVIQLFVEIRKTDDYEDNRLLEFEISQNKLEVTNMNIKLTDQFTIYWTTQKYASRIDCMFDSPWTDKAACDSRGCVYDEEYHPHVPLCYYPDNYEHYYVEERNEGQFELDSTLVNGLQLILRLSPNAVFTPSLSYGPDDQIKLLQCIVYFLDTTSVRIKITDMGNERFEVPV